MSSTLPPNTAHGSTKWNYGLAFWRGDFLSVAISIRPKILKPACLTIWRSTTPIMPIRIVGRIRDNPWCERHRLAARVVNNVMVGHGLAHGPNDLNVSFIRPDLTTYLPCPWWRKANNFRGLFAFLPFYVATIKWAYNEK